MKARETAATLFLKNAGVSFTPFPYQYDSNAKRVGLHAAAALGIDAHQIFKTLMCEANGLPVCAIIPADCELSLKKIAKISNAKSAAMMNPTKAESVTGFKIGGISPFGQRKKVQTFLDESAQFYTEIYVNVGARGLLICVDCQSLINTFEFTLADIKA